MQLEIKTQDKDHDEEIKSRLRPTNRDLNNAVIKSMHNVAHAVVVSINRILVSFSGCARKLQVVCDVNNLAMMKFQDKSKTKTKLFKMKTKTKSATFGLEMKTMCHNAAPKIYPR